MSNGLQAELKVEDEAVMVTAPDLLAHRQGRLFFRSILGATPVADGYRCPRRQTSIAALVVRINSWLEREGFEVHRLGVAEDAVEEAARRRRSFVRTQAAAQEFKNDPTSFDLSAVEAALNHAGWLQTHELRDHQRAGVAHSLSAIYSANFSVPGSGKTATALAVGATHLLNGTIDAILVVGPLASFDPWERETSVTLPGLFRVRRVRGTVAERHRSYAETTQNSLLLCSYATAAADRTTLVDLCRRLRIMLVADESHRIKRLRGGLWAPALVGIAHQARVRMILSGTPMPQSGRDLFRQLTVLWPEGELAGTADAFAARVDNNFAAVLADINPFISRTPKVALGLPPYQVVSHEVGLEGTQQEIYDLIANRFRRQLVDAKAWQDKIAVLRRNRPLRLLQAAANPRLLNARDAYFALPPVVGRGVTLMERVAAYGREQVPAKTQYAIDLVRGFAEAGEKVVCWSNFVSNLDDLTSRLQSIGIKTYQIDGRVPVGEDSLHDDPLAHPGRNLDEETTREEIIDRFLTTDGPAVLVTNPASCSESISLHSACHRAIYLDRTYDCALFLQSIDRIHRLGLPADVTVEIHLLLATNGGAPTIDHLVDASLDAKEARMRQLLEGAELRPLGLSESPSRDAEGDDSDIEALLRFLLGENPEV